ncbi:unnamed protein product [Mycena citricolor]|uniref:Uncharacterized protein n=1 Tax=Mycena citricolor TaxID=2018698 RepID=A0AAD2H3X6_9AGAR|nr:unnamed protein product [Mycena citricolor]
MQNDQDKSMSHEPYTPPPRIRIHLDRDSHGSSQHKRAAAPGPTREKLDQVRQSEQFHKQVAVDARSNLTRWLNSVATAQSQMAAASAEVLCLQETLRSRDVRLDELVAEVHEREDEVETLRLQIKQNARSKAQTGQAKRRGGRVSKDFFDPGKPDLLDLAMDPAPLPGSSTSSPAASSPAAPNPVIEEVATKLNMDVDLLTQFFTAMKMVKEQTVDINVSPGKSTQRRKSSRKSDAKAAVAPKSQDLVNQAHSMMRSTTYAKFGVQQATDFIFHDPATKDEVEEFTEDDQATIQKYQWDFGADYKSSAWNAAVMERLVADVVKEDSHNMHYVQKGLISQDFLRLVVEDQLVRYRADWNKFQPKWDEENGHMETTEEAIARGKIILFNRRVSARTVNAQHMKYKHCRTTVTATITLKESEGADDLPTWERLLELLDLLGAGGMSEEEESYSLDNGTKVKSYIIKICVWREPLIVDYMRIIDKQTSRFQALHSGNKPAPRVRVETKAVRPAPKELPACLYSSEWIASLSSADLKELKVSKKVFALFFAATGRMAK